MLDSLLNTSVVCDCGATHEVHIKSVQIGRGVVAATGAVAQSLDWTGPLALVVDSNTRRAAGEAVASSLTAAGFSYNWVNLPDHPVASPESVQHVQTAVGDASAVVAVGSGTINDIVKSAAHALHRPYLVVGTALSMNGYTSSISALLDGGIKRTVQTKPAQAVILDLDICAAAPRDMTLAGLGDMLSKPFSEADWRLASRVDGGYHCPRPGGILNEPFQQMLRDAAAIGQGKAESMVSLAESVALSGISMAMAGVSSPASGGEHLISHYWDMMQYGQGKHPYAWHGTQVGVACCMVEPVHHRLQGITADAIDVGDCMADWPEDSDALIARVRARHSLLPDDAVESVIEQALQKWRSPAAQRERLESIRGRLDEIQRFVGEALLKAGAVRQALVDAGGSTEPHDVDPSLAGSLDRWHIVRDMRSRYTILDLADELGWFPKTGSHKI